MPWTGSSPWKYKTIIDTLGWPVQKPWAREIHHPIGSPVPRRARCPAMTRSRYADFGVGPLEGNVPHRVTLKINHGTAALEAATLRRMIAKAASPTATSDQIRRMLQTLLAQRFHPRTRPGKSLFDPSRSRGSQVSSRMSWRLRRGRSESQEAPPSPTGSRSRIWIAWPRTRQR